MTRNGIPTRNGSPEEPNYQETTSEEKEHSHHITTTPITEPVTSLPVLRRSNRLVANDHKQMNEHKQIAPNITKEDSDEEEESGGNHDEDEEVGKQKWAIDGIKSTQLRVGEDGRTRKYYEVQWEGCPDSENTYELGKDIVDTATTRKWKKLADKGRAADRQSSKNRDQINSVYAVRNKTGLMEAPLAHKPELRRSTYCGRTCSTRYRVPRK